MTSINKSLFMQSIASDKIMGKRAEMMILDDPCERIRSSGKFAPVAPYHIYQQFAVNGYVPATVLLLAHDVVANADGYQETFEDPAFRDTRIIMDNSLVELKQAVDMEMVYEAAEITGADIVVLPDVMGDGAASAKKTLEHWDDWSWKFRAYQKMVVLHGMDMPNWLASAETIRELIAPDWISLPRKLEEGEGAKYSRRDYLRLVVKLFPDTPVHLLGFSDFVWEDLWCASNPNVKSIDSAVPLRLTRSTHILSDDAGPRGDWWESARFDPQMIENCQAIDDLISSPW